MKQRIFLFDSIKFFLIFLVVFGHMMESNRAVSYNGQIYGWIYLFHMPLFIFISGYFSKQYDERNCFLKSVILLLETLTIFHVGSIFFKLIVHGKTIGLADLVIPGYGSWYLLSLIYWRVMLQYIPDKWIHSYWILLGSIVISLFGGYVPIGGVLSIQRSFTFLPFFLIGYLIKEKKSLDMIRISPIIATILIAIISAIVLPISNMENGGEQIHSVMMGTYSYFKGEDFIPHPLLSRSIFLIASSIMCLCVLSVFPNKIIPLITSNGKNTLFFFVYHAFVFRLILLFFSKNMIETNTLNLLIGAILVMIILMVLKNISFLWWLLNPISKSIKKI